jgi:hypothetical protein
MKNFLLKLEGTLRTKIGPTQAEAIAAALPWLITAVFFWVAATHAVVAVLVPSVYAAVVALIFTVLFVVALVINPTEKSFVGRTKSSLTDYSQVGLLASAGMLFLPALIAHSTTWLVSALVVATVAGLFTFALSFVRPGTLISHKSDSLSEASLNHEFDDACVAIVMPCWNEERFISDAIKSVQAQTHKNWELTIVDDGSSDDSTRIAVAAAAKDKRIRVIRLRRNSGLPSARNAGFAFTKSPCVIFLDSDDALLPTALENRLKLVGLNPEAWGVGFRTRQVPESTDWRTIREPAPKSNVAWINLPSTIGDSPFGVHEMMVRSSRIRQLSGFSESMVGGAEDAHFWLRSLRSGANYVRNNSIDSIYRQKSGSMIGDNLVRQANVTVQVMVDSWKAQVQSDLSVADAHETTGDILLKQRIQLRLFRFLGMTYFGSDPKVRPEIEAMIEQYLPIVIDGNRMMDCLRFGVMRNIARDPELNQIVEADKYIDQFNEVIKKWISIDADLLAPREAHPINAVFVENAAQFANLNKALANVSDEKLPVLVIADSLDAPQGAWNAVAASGRSFVIRSIPGFALEGAEYAQLFVPSPVSWIGEQVATLYAGTKSSVRTWELPWSAGVTIDDEDYLADRTMVFGIDADSVSTEQLVSSLSSHATVHRVELPTLPWPTVNSVDNNGSGGDYTGLITPDIEKLRALKDKHKGERCIIIGNGPSLNQTDFSLLTDQSTFGVNGIFYADDRLPQPLTYYVVEDTKVFEENTEAILEYGRGCGEIILPTLYKKSVANPEEVTFFRMNGGFYRKQDPNFCRPRFSTNAEEVLFCGQSVTFINLQLAYWMGFSEVALIGMDFSYTLPPGTVVKGHLYESQEDDPNHFDPRYFGAGKTWKNPYLNRVGANYEIAKVMFEADGRKVYNCTVGGKLEVFDRLDLADFVNGSR